MRMCPRCKTPMNETQKQSHGLDASCFPPTHETSLLSIPLAGRQRFISTKPAKGKKPLLISGLGDLGSMLAGCVFYAAVNGFFASVLSVPRGSVGSTFCLINLTFGFKFLVASNMPSSFFRLAHGLVCSTLNVFTYPYATSVSLRRVFAN